MKVAIDIGNSNIVIGVFDNGVWKHLWRIETHTICEALPFYESKLNNLFLENDVDFEEISSVIISSVVPDKNEIFKHLFQSIYGLKLYWLNATIYSALPIGIHNPLEIGTDLVSNALAAHLRYNKNCIIVDFGTALTFTTLTQAGEIIGVSIVPGLMTAVKTLSLKTAQLPEVVLSKPKSALGYNTTSAIQSGIYYGYTGLVKNMVNTLKGELEGECLVIATGGLCNQLKSLDDFFDEKELTLTLDGLIDTLVILEKG